MLRSVGHLLNRQQSAAWGAWVEMTIRRGFMLRGVEHQRNRQQSAAWGAWVERTNEHAAFMRKLRKGVDFMVSRYSALAFNRWWYLNHLQHERARSAERMKLALRYSINHHLSSSWVAWHSSWAESTKKLHAMRQSLSHLLRCKLSRSWNMWLETTTECTTLHQKMLALSIHLTGRALSVGFVSWHQWARRRANDQAVLSLSTLVCMLDRSLERTFRTWHAMVVGLWRRSSYLQYALGHMRDRALALAWRAWLETASQSAAAAPPRLLPLVDDVAPPPPLRPLPAPAPSGRAPPPRRPPSPPPRAVLGKHVRARQPPPAPPQDRSPSRQRVGGTAAAAHRLARRRSASRESAPPQAHPRRPAPPPPAALQPRRAAAPASREQKASVSPSTAALLATPRPARPRPARPHPARPRDYDHSTSYSSPNTVWRSTEGPNRLRWHAMPMLESQSTPRRLQFAEWEANAPSGVAI